MKRGKGGDSTEAIRAVWMEGYERGRAVGRQAGAPPVVEIEPANIVAAYAHPCANPTECPACAARLEYERDTEDPEDRDPKCEAPGAPGYPRVDEPAEEER